MLNAKPTAATRGLKESVFMVVVSRRWREWTYWLQLYSIVSGGRKEPVAT
jgi:hypothetical protein